MADTTPTTDPSVAQAAQIPLQSFTLPTFPPEASELRALTLTCDIKLDEYQTLVSSATEPVPQLPTSIASLTLELFSLGYPPGWLSQLGQRLPNLKTITIFSGLVDGLDDKSRADAEAFFKEKLSSGLRELHLLDVFCRPGFVKSIANHGGQLQFLEFSYTYRGHSDPQFLARVPGDELPAFLLSPSLVAASFSLSAPPPPPEKTTDEEGTLEDPSNLDEKGDLIDNRRPEGIMPLQPSASTALVSTLTGQNGSNNDKKQGLMMLDLTLYTLSTAQMTEILSTHARTLGVFSASIAISSADESWRKDLLKSLSAASNLEVLDLVGVPSVEFYDQVSANEGSKKTTSILSTLFPSISDLTSSCPNLTSFKMSILRATAGFGSVEFTRSDPKAEWKGGVVDPTESELPPRWVPDAKNDPWRAERRERPGGAA